MKIRITVFLISIAVFSFSCVDVLDLHNTRALSEQAAWSSEQSADLYITAVYATIRDISQVSESRLRFFDSFSDIMKSTSWDQYNHAYNRSLQQATVFQRGTAGPHDCWVDAYTRIRRANVKLTELESIGVPSFGEDWAKLRRAEIRLCRAFSYYRLIRVYGGVILRTEKSGTSGGLDDGLYEADTHKARSTEAQSWKFVLDELQAAADDLPDEWPADWYGRATKKTAYGFLSRMALFAQEWEIAARAAEKVTELGGDLAPDYAKVFQVEGGQDNSKEILFGLFFLNRTVTHQYDERNRPFGDQVANPGKMVYAEHVPTAELADMYEFKDGKPFSWDDWQNWEHNGEKNVNPFTNREPRFHATVLFNGAIWEGREIQTYLDADGVDSRNGTDAFFAYVQTGHTNSRTPTGYYLRKYLQENHNYVDDNSYQYDAVLRYAEVLLNKAEAYAEWDFMLYRTQALAALNKVRERVNLPPRTADDAPNKDAFMALLRKERIVELAGEGFRFWDLRRWRLAESVIHGQMAHGVRIYRNDGDGSLTYQRVNCDADVPRIFLPTYYYLSLPTSEISSNNLAVDNPNW